ncbi:MAG: hypothetical protein F6K35_32040 [Okeania sp. SIO2H7]|nr:hypothetical protein [Okeania sp. SIO2H7]
MKRTNLANSIPDDYFSNWLEYSEKNKENHLKYLGPIEKITPAEAKKIHKSIQEFQLGEASEGLQLIKHAQSWSKKINNPDYLKIIKLFIGEENRHSGYLAAFLKSQDLSLGKKSFTDKAFRTTRNLFGLEVSIRVLAAAEIIATIYYPCLMVATSNEYLKSICTRITKEEIEHVKFQMQNLAALNLNKNEIWFRFSNLLHLFFILGTSIIILPVHLPVIQSKYGKNPISFLNAVIGEAQKAMALIKKSRDLLVSRS